MVPALVAALVALGWGLLLRARASAWGLVDLPNERSSHSQPRPRAAGVGVALGAVAAALLWAAADHLGLSTAFKGVLALSGALGAVGFLDDRWGLPVRSRLAAQTVAAVALIVLLGSSVDSVGGVWWLLLPLAVVVVVGATNMFNFMDGIDGIAGGTGLAAATTWVVLGWTHDLEALAALGAGVGAACAGFLVLNWSPAKVFMGDSGSLFLGFLTASVPIVLAVADLGAGLLAAVPLLPFLVDGASTVARRLRAGEALTKAHRSHLYQRTAARVGHAPVAAAYAFLSALTGIAGATLVSTTRAAAYYCLAIATVMGGLWLWGSQVCERNS